MGASNSTADKKEVVVIGAGTGGCIVASQLLRKGSNEFNVTMVDPAERHYYQPGWTLVGAGIKPFDWSWREMKSVIPKKANLVQDEAVNIDPDTNTVTLKDKGSLKYDYLVVAAGLENDWKFVPGVAENVFKEGSPVVSNYAGGAKTAAAIATFPEGGTALFQVPSGVVKCGGAPIKACFLSWDFWQHKGMDLKKMKIEFMTPSPAVFAVKHYLPAIEKLFKEREITTLTSHALKEIHVPAPSGTPEPASGVPPYAGVALVEDKNSGSIVQKPFHMMHVVPPMRAPAVVRESKVANAAGFVDVDAKTLQSVNYPNVWAIGDCSGCPTSKTAAAAIAQAPVLVHNLLRFNRNERPSAVYNGYTSCPLLVGRYPPQLLLMEFDYDKNPYETFPWDQRVSDGLRGRVHYYIKEKVFPAAYWQFALSGRWFGSSTVFEPKFL